VWATVCGRGWPNGTLRKSYRAYGCPLFGATYTQGLKGPGGRRVAADDRITAFEPGKRLAFEAIAGPVRPTGEYVLEDVVGATNVTFSLDAQLGGIQKLLMGGMVQKTMDAEVGALANLKRVLESA